MSRTDHHSNKPRTWTERVRGVRYTVVKQYHRGPSARDAIREQLAEMLLLDVPAVIRMSVKPVEQYDGLQSVGTYTIQTRGYATPEPPRLVNGRRWSVRDGVQPEMDARPKVQHVIPTRRVYDDSVRDCWREQTSRRSSFSIVDVLVD
jgi:hypothetical protein